jgi:chromosome segregation ATPase
MMESQQAEAKAATAQEKERGLNERLNQTLSRMAVMEAQVSCLRAEQAQLQRSLEKERQRASENRQEYLVSTEAAATHEGRARQLEEEIKTIRKQYKSELNEEKARREALEQVPLKCYNFN